MIHNIDIQLAASKFHLKTGFFNAKLVLLSLFMVLLIPSRIFAQQDSINSKPVLETDTLKIQAEKVPAEKIKAYRNNNAFKYDMEEKPGFDFWSVFWYWVGRILRAIFSNEGPAPYIRYLIMLLVVAFVIYKIVGGNFSRIFSKNKKIKPRNGLEYNNENIYEENLEEKLNTAINNNLFREAIRYYYILLLKELDLHSLIKWEIGKTNRDYQRELLKNHLKDNFISLSGIFEYCWYGRFEIDEMNFTGWQNRFKSTLLDIRQSK